MIDLGGAPSGTPAEASRLLRECWIRALDAVDVTAPAPPMGLGVLREALGNLLNERPENILVTSGVRATVPLLGRRLAYLTLETPTFRDIAVLAEALGHRVEPSPHERLFTGGKALWVTHPARNPDGATLSSAELARLRRAPWETVVVNESYRWYAAPAPDALPPGWFTVGSLNKLVGTGVRIGWIRGPGVGALNGPGVRVSGPAAVAQWAWARFVGHGGIALFQRQLTAAPAAAAAFRDAAAGVLRERTPGGQGPSLLALLPPPWTSRRAVGELRAAGLVVGLGEAFLATRPSVRVCFTGVTLAEAAEAGRRYHRTIGGTPP